MLSLGSAAYTGWLLRMVKSVPFFRCSASNESREMIRTKPLWRDWIINVFCLLTVITLMCCHDCLVPTDWGSHVCNWELTSLS